MKRVTVRLDGEPGRDPVRKHDDSDSVKRFTYGVPFSEIVGPTSRLWVRLMADRESGDVKIACGIFGVNGQPVLPPRAFGEEDQD